MPGQVRRAQRRVQQPADVLPVVLGAKSNQSNQINHYKMQTNRLARIQRGSAALLVSPVIHAPRRRRAASSPSSGSLCANTRRTAAPSLWRRPRRTRRAGRKGPETPAPKHLGLQLQLRMEVSGREFGAGASNLQIIALLDVEMQPVLQLLEAGGVLQEPLALAKGFEDTALPREKPKKAYCIPSKFALEGKTRLLGLRTAKRSCGRTRRACTGGSRRGSWGAGAR